MNIRSKRFLTVLLTLIFAITVFTVTAFAEGVAIASENQTPPSSETAATSTGDPTTKPEDPTTKPEDPTTKPEDPTTKPEDPTTKPEDPTTKPEDPTTKPGNDSKSPSSKAIIPNHDVDTHTNRVEAAASQAAQAVSDPDVLSSENWGELLSSGTQNQSAAAAGAATISSTAAAANVGGVSMILIFGVVLIILALCGIGLFVYLQFFSNRNGGGYGPKGPKNHSGGASKKSIDEPAITSFTDISSDSDGTQHRGDYVPEDEHNIHSNSTPAAAPVAPALKPQAVKRPSAPNPKTSVPKPQAAKKASSRDQDATAPIPQPVLPNRKPAVPTQGVEPLSKSQATPVSNSSDFDWEKFFNDQK